MNKAKRCQSVMLSATVALGAAGACPATSPARGLPKSAKTITKSSPHRTRSGRATYTYKLYVIDGEGPHHESLPVGCTGQSALFPRAFLHEADEKSGPLFHYHDGEPTTFNVTLDARTRLVTKGPYASRVRTLPDVCLANERPLSGTYGGTVDPGIFTWRLSRPAHNLVELTSHPATKAEITTGDTA
jgi:hypothetical protein